jgi:hypothetical protein
MSAVQVTFTIKDVVKDTKTRTRVDAVICSSQQLPEITLLRKTFSAEPYKRREKGLCSHHAQSQRGT